MKTDYLIKNTYSLFWGGPYSQWTLADFEFNGMKFNCNEQFMMYLKALVHDDFDTAKKVMKEFDPSKQKKLGRQVKDFTEKKWNYDVSMAVVYVANYCKFTQNEDFWEYLKNDPAIEIVEASPFDKIWGIGLGTEDKRAWNKKSWKGENRLGKCITQVRSFLTDGDPELGKKERHNLRIELVKSIMHKMKLNEDWKQWTLECM